MIYLSRGTLSIPKRMFFWTTSKSALPMKFFGMRMKFFAKNWQYIFCRQKAHPEHSFCLLCVAFFIPRVCSWQNCKDNWLKISNLWLVSLCFNFLRKNNGQSFLLDSTHREASLYMMKNLRLRLKEIKNFPPYFSLQQHASACAYYSYVLNEAYWSQLPKIFP